MAGINALGFDLHIDEATIEQLVREGYHRTLGARPMRNTVDRYLQERIASTTLV
jgi:ATP-dependent Clp protease ATP-binding subunit ClpB